MSKYEYEYDKDDKYCYKNSDVLINKFGIRDAKVLGELEDDFTTLTIPLAYKFPIIGSFDLKHLQRIHKNIFGDIYKWAGEIRTVNISKGVQFCQYPNIKNQFHVVYKELINDNFLMDMQNIEEAIEKYSYYLSEINVIHPFREGNGRTQRIYLNYLSRMSGYKLDFNKTTQEKMIEASYEGFHCRYEKMERLIRKCISTISNKEKEHYIKLFKEELKH